MDEKWQGIRNTLYAVAGSLTAILAAVGFIDQSKGAEALTLANSGLDLIGAAIALDGLGVAWWKSRKGKVTTLSIPTAQVLSYTTLEGKVIAGPGNPLPTGTVIAGPGIDQAA